MQNKPARILLAGLLLPWAPSLWSQASLTGKITEKLNGAPINGVMVVLEHPNKIVISNGDGEFKIDGLQEGLKIHALYKKAGYGSCFRDVALTGPKTDGSVGLYKNLTKPSYWSGVSKSIEAGAQDPAAKRNAYERAWIEINDSTLTPEAKVAAAHQFQTGMGSVASDNAALASLQAYSLLDKSDIAQANKEFHKAISGSTKLNGTRIELPGTVAADVAAQQLYQAKKSGDIPKEFLSDFKTAYGDQATVALEKKFDGVKKGDYVPGSGPGGKDGVLAGP
jgi:hypothetical protein